MKKRIIITIDAEFGSNFQKELADKAIYTVMEGLALYLRNTHKKNVFTYKKEEFNKAK